MREFSHYSQESVKKPDTLDQMHALHTAISLQCLSQTGSHFLCWTMSKLSDKPVAFSQCRHQYTMAQIRKPQFSHFPR